MGDNFWIKIDGLLAQCQNNAEKVNSVTEALLGGGHILFKPLSLPRPKTGCSELIFLRTLFWLSGLFHECGGKPLRYCMRQTQFDDQGDRCLIFLKDLRALRTQSAHNLDSSLECDFATEAACSSWFKRICKLASPINESDWSKCCEHNLGEAIELFTKLLAFLEFLKSNSDAGPLKEGLLIAINGNVSPYAFDDIVESVANDLGRTNLNLEKFRASHFKNWNNTLDKLAEGYDFNYEARRIVERTFLADPEPLPITGRDIIDMLGVQPGPEVGRLLDLARQLTHERHHKRDELLKQLQHKITGST